MKSTISLKQNCMSLKKTMICTVGDINKGVKGKDKMGGRREILICDFFLQL